MRSTVRQITERRCQQISWLAATKVIAAVAVAIAVLQYKLLFALIIVVAVVDVLLRSQGCVRMAGLQTQKLYADLWGKEEEEENRPFSAVFKSSWRTNSQGYWPMVLGKILLKKRDAAKSSDGWMILLLRSTKAVPCKCMQGMWY